jgi:hypothetical protein
VEWVGDGEGGLSGAVARQRSQDRVMVNRLLVLVCSRAEEGAERGVKSYTPVANMCRPYVFVERLVKTKYAT